MYSKTPTFLNTIILNLNKSFSGSVCWDCSAWQYRESKVHMPCSEARLQYRRVRQQTYRMYISDSVHIWHPLHRWVWINFYLLYFQKTFTVVIFSHSPLYTIMKPSTELWPCLKTWGLENRISSVKSRCYKDECPWYFPTCLSIHPLTHIMLVNFLLLWQMAEMIYKENNLFCRFQFLIHWPHFWERGAVQGSAL